MSENRVGNQKRAKRESLIRKELSKLFLSIKISDPNLEDLYINSIELSADKSSAYVLFFCLKGEEHFNEKLPHLILYKPSVRKALSQILDSRYTPQIIFRYDKMMEKQAKIVNLLDKVKAEVESLSGNFPSETSSLDKENISTDNNCDSCESCDSNNSCCDNSCSDNDSSDSCNKDNLKACDQDSLYKNAVCDNDSVGISSKSE